MRASPPEDTLRLVLDLAAEAVDIYAEPILYWWDQLKERNRRMRELDGYADAPRTYISYVPQLPEPEANSELEFMFECPYCGAGFHFLSPVGNARGCRRCRRQVSFCDSDY